MHPNLSPELQQFIALAEKNKGFQLAKLSKGTLFEMITQNSVYTAVVTNPQKNEIAMTGTREELRKPALYTLQGSTFGGSAVKIGWIGVGLRPRLHPLTGGIVVLSKLRAFTLINDKKKTREIVKAAELQRPKRPSKRDIQRWNKKVEEIIRRFDPDHVDWVRQFVSFFNNEGKAIMLGLLEKAREVGKMQEAIRVLSRHFDEHWCYRAPEIRGSFITETDVLYVERAYSELGLPSPGRG